MTIQNFDVDNFKPFQTSSGINEDSTGEYDGKVVRIFHKNIEDYKNVLIFSEKLPTLIKSKLFYEDDKLFVIEHEKLENITYFNEWTKKQRVLAAGCVIKLQSELTKLGYYLQDPHAFNITFKYYKPIYFDFGSISKGKINPTWWFIKGFCGWTEHDYWDEVLKINFIRKILITIQVSFSSSPYQFLLKKISKFEEGFFEKNINLMLRKKSLASKIIRKIVNGLPLIFRNFSNWTDYKQKKPELDFNNVRNKNILQLFNLHRPKMLLDIGANKGAYSLLALENGIEEVIGIDLDNYSLDYLLNQVKKNNHKVTIARLNIMNYPEHPGYYHSYFPAHERLYCNFTICLAVVHHVCYFGKSSFEDFAERLNRFTKKILIVEFIPYNDIHLSGPIYKGKDRSWYTSDNFIKIMKKWFPGEHEIFESSPSPRILIKFCK